MSVLNSFSLQGKTALVTGCNKGIGFGMTLALADGRVSKNQPINSWAGVD
jgi:hypothetical protein